MEPKVSHRKQRSGVVVSNAADKTIVVKVTRMAKHPLYRKLIKINKKYHAHDEKNIACVGDVVNIKQGKYIKASFLSDTKTEEKKCPFIDEENLCMIHRFKPDVCNIFQCSKIYPEIKFSNINNKYKLPSQTKDGIATIEYIGKNGFKFNKKDYLKALELIDNG